MSKVWWMCLVVSLAATACGDDGRGDSDGGGETDASGDTITIPDTNIPDTAEDTMMADTNDPPPTGECTLEGQAPSAGCYPRCSAATGAAVQACMDNACVEAALMADTTPAVTVPMLGQFDCFNCFAVGSTQCAQTACPMEFNALVQCATPCIQAGMPQQQCIAACPDENAAIDTCVAASMAFQDCAGPAFARCFP